MNIIKNRRNKTIALIAIICIIISGIIIPHSLAESSNLDETQRNAIAMLNYITVLTQEINTSKNSRLYMEQAYSSLINNTYPNSVDSRTLSQLTGLLDTMESYRMVNVKRDRLQYIYEQNKAQAIRAAIPNPLTLLPVLETIGYTGTGESEVNTKVVLAKIAAAIVYMAVDSVTSYISYKTESDLQYLSDDWSLDDEASSALHISKKSAFNYMVKMVNEYDLPGDLTLTENDVEDFVKWKNNDNVVRRIQYLEANRSTYQSFGGYWLLLAESYYENGDYSKVMESLSSYKAMNSRIFRKDHELARILPLAVAAADQVLEGKKYVEAVSEYAQLLLQNTEYDDWALRYFAAQSYIDLFGKTKDTGYVQKAYDIVLNNVNYLIDEQRTMNATYIAPIQETPIPNGATEDDKKQIKNYNRAIREARNTELPPVSEPLLLNCELLFALADELNISELEQEKIGGILHPNDNPAFLTLPLDMKYRFHWESDIDSLSASISSILSTADVEFGGFYIVMPAAYVTDQANITVSIKNKSYDGNIVFDDWKIDKVQRLKENDISSFHVAYTSDKARNFKWKPDTEIDININPKVGADAETVHFEYLARGTKNNWYDYFKVWEGHKNNWYNYVEVWENSVVFERNK